uniref:DB domain-containing protein n=2 Tax=Caenorhabditis japonica TaxID=281687 RepID=A0A8R1DFU9_CAEJA
MLSISALLVAFLTFSKESDACVASGTCGLGPCFNPIPPVASPCASAGCGPGFSCGTYGCFRTKARVHAAGTHQGPILFGADRFSQFRRQPAQQQPTDPNALFMQCCEQRGLPDACLQKCTFNTYTKESLTRMYFRQDACPLAASAEIQFCAAQGRDHRSCCVRNGVTTTLAGDKCLTFCDQRPGNVTLLDYSYVSCYDRFENMKSCFWHDAAERLRGI